MHHRNQTTAFVGVKRENEQERERETEGGGGEAVNAYEEKRK